MKNSQKFKLKILTNKISYVLLAALIIYIFTRYIIIDLLPIINKWIILSIYAFVVTSILIILIYSITKHNNFSKTEKEKIYYDLDHSTEKVFKKFGLYITKNYIICLGSKLNIFNLFVVPIKDIDAIDTHRDSRYYYRKKGQEPKHKFLSFIISSIKTNTMSGNNDIHVFNIICGKKVYCVTTASSLNKKKINQIAEIADYICGRYKNIDYI